MTSDSSIAALIAGVLALVGIAALLARRSSLRGTTLVASWWWSLGCALAIAAVEIFAGFAAPAASPSGIQAARFAAAMTSLCPAAAALGAKRPQDRAWQFVVLTLLAVLCLPSIEWVLRGEMPEIHPARAWFLMIVIGGSVLNGLPTRFWPSSLLTCLAQLALVAPHLTAVEYIEAGAGAALTGLALLAGAWGLAALGIPRSGRALLPLDGVWLDFRDVYPAAWSLRVMQRLNASAAMYDWPVTLAWRGFVARSNGVPVDQVPPAVEETLRTLLRRFVSQEWIDARLQARALRATGSAGRRCSD